MSLSLFLAKLIGIYMLIIAFIWFLCKNQLEHAFKKIFSSDHLLVLSGSLSLLVGLAIVVGHPIWEWDWRGLITIIGCIGIIKGIINLAFPIQLQKISSKILPHSHWIILILVIFGVYLTYSGFTNS